MNTYGLTQALVMPNAFSYAGHTMDVHIFEDAESGDASWTLEASHVGHAENGDVYPSAFALIEAMGIIENGLETLGVHGDNMGDLVAGLINGVRGLIANGIFKGAN